MSNWIKISTSVTLALAFITSANADTSSLKKRIEERRAASAQSGSVTAIAAAPALAGPVVFVTVAKYWRCADMVRFKEAVRLEIGGKIFPGALVETDGSNHATTRFDLTGVSGPVEIKVVAEADRRRKMFMKNDEWSRKQLGYSAKIDVTKSPFNFFVIDFSLQNDVAWNGCFAVRDRFLTGAEYVTILDERKKFESSDEALFFTKWMINQMLARQVYYDYFITNYSNMIKTSSFKVGSKSNFIEDSSKKILDEVKMYK